MTTEERFDSSMGDFQQYGSCHPSHCGVHRQEIADLRAKLDQAEMALKAAASELVTNWFPIREERDALLREQAQTQEHYDFALGRLDQAEARARRLEEALVPRIGHKGDCSYIDDGRTCSCGALDAALAPENPPSQSEES